ncbi:MAG: O-antigen ligase family protein, partial [Fervidobacterium sp.]
MLSIFEEVLWYATIPLVALFAHRNYTYEFSTPKYAILCVSVTLLGFYLFSKVIKTREFKFFTTPIHWVWLAFSIISLLSTINTYTDNRFFFRQAIDIGLYLFLNVLISFYLSSRLERKDNIIKFLFLFVLTGLFISINAILNFYTGFDIFLGEVGKPFERASIKANIGNVIFVSNYLNMLLPIALYFVVSLDVGVLDPKSTWKVVAFKITSLISAFLYFVVIIFSQTRSEYLALVIEFTIIVGVYIIYIKKRQDNFAKTLEKTAPHILKKLMTFRKVAISIFLILIILTIIIYNIPTPFNNYGKFTMANRFSAMASVSGRDERFLSWFSTIYIWKNHKLLGQGISTYQIYGLYGISDLIEEHPEYNYGWNNFKRAHNDYFQILSETGILGLSAIIIMLVLLVLYVTKNIKNIQEKDDLVLFCMLVLSGVVFAFQSFFSFPGHLLPNALLANFVISVGLGRYFNKVNGKEYILKGKKSIIIALILVIVVCVSTYLRWNHFISEVYFRNGNVAFNTLSALREEQSKVEYYLKQIEKMENDLNNFSGGFEQLSPENWHKIRKAESQKLGTHYNEMQSESERQSYISKLREKINNQKTYLLDRQKNLPNEIEEQYEIAKYNLLKSIKLNHTYGKSHFYLAALATDPIRIQELRTLLSKDPDLVLNQKADELQKIIPDKFRYNYYNILSDYLKEDKNFL